MENTSKQADQIPPPPLTARFWGQEALEVETWTVSECVSECVSVCAAPLNSGWPSDMNLPPPESGGEGSYPPMKAALTQQQGRAKIPQTVRILKSGKTVAMFADQKLQQKHPSPRLIVLAFSCCRIRTSHLIMGMKWFCLDWSCRSTTSCCVFYNRAKLY